MSTLWEEGWVSFDTETTGFGTSARVLEFGAVYFEHGEPVHEWSTLLCPTDLDWNDPKIQEALTINKLTREQLIGQPTFEQMMPNILAELSVDTWVSHNAEFDVKMLNQELARMGRTALQPKVVVCTMMLSRQAGHRTNKLSDVAGRYGIPQPAAHRATVDAEVCGRVLAEMMKRGEVPKDRDPLAQLVRKTASLGKSFNR